MTEESYITDIPQNTKPTTGGEIYYNMAYGKILIISIMVIIIIISLYYLFISYKNNETYEQAKLRINFNNTHGEEFDEEAKEAIRYGEIIENPRAIDHFRLGTIYLRNAHNLRRAHDHYFNALNMVINGEAAIDEAGFIIDRIVDQAPEFIELDNVEFLPLEEAIMANFELNRKTVHHINKKKLEIKEDDPEYTQKVLLNKQSWYSDSQNVHDSAINREMINQLNQVKEENGKIPELENRTYEELKRWAYQVGDKDKDKLNKVFDRTDTNIEEINILEALWKRAHHPNNSKNKEEMKLALKDAIIDCVEGSNVVCHTGICTKLWAAPATLDFDPTVGVIKSKQMLKNEIYEKSAKIVNDFYGENGLASDSVKEAYIKNEPNVLVDETNEQIKTQIENLRNEYKGIVDDVQLNQIINECIDVI